MEYSIQKALFSNSAQLVFNFFLATVGGIFIGFLPEVFLEKLLGSIYYDSVLEPISPAIFLTAMLLGYFVAYRVLALKTAPWTWVLGALWLMVAVRELGASWTPPGESRFGDVMANLFGPASKCGESECLYEMFFTTPFAASVAYSIGSYLRKRGL